MSSDWPIATRPLSEAHTLSGGAASKKVRVVVADDHPLYREGVVRALTASGSVEVVGEAEDGASAFELIKTHRPRWRFWTLGCPAWTAPR